jgi:hypothetical protein
MIETPVLFAAFARPEYAKQTFNAIKKAKPKKFYFYSNKGRTDIPDEIERNNQVRALINDIDWDCELRTYFRDKYVDIYTSLWSAYDWIFENEEQAIIFEEDCVPCLAFFDFCELLLPKYKDDWRIWVISGNNFFESFNPNGYDYIFTRFPFQYGWASWRNRWQKIERQNIPWEEMKRYELNRQLYSLSRCKTNLLTKKEEKIFLFLKKNPAWDYTLGFTMKKEGAFGIIPAVNLVQNIGHIGEHDKGDKSIVHNKVTFSSDVFNIKNSPPFIVPDFKYDQHLFFHMFYKRSSFFYRIWNKMLHILK